MSVNRDDVQNSYTCGNCRNTILYLATDEAPVPCPECGYHHKSRPVSDVPPIVKLDLNKY